ncbi:hypothetical protein SAMN05661093_10837 [Kibdelosporangium aridum]|uniref:Uncharacterized protein n=1 Tax=Kibdelosporangium aridum TaxID=2030 RepID=A0A1Y5Y9K0_KIBAR|nr:hypothetical protein SAMN05661093_10837 [Kibdelosporangium aridum]
MDYQAGQIGRVVAVLPRLIKTAQQIESNNVDEADNRLAATVSARITT